MGIEKKNQLQGEKSPLLQQFVKLNQVIFIILHFISKSFDKIGFGKIVILIVNITFK